MEEEEVVRPVWSLMQLLDLIAESHEQKEAEKWVPVLWVEEGVEEDALESFDGLRTEVVVESDAL